LWYEFHGNIVDRHEVPTERITAMLHNLGMRMRDVRSVKEESSQNYYILPHGILLDEGETVGSGTMKGGKDGMEQGRA
jgi:hypothetical protein